MVTALAAGFLAACGGGGGSGGTPSTGGGDGTSPVESTVASVELLGAASTVGSAGTSGVVLTALAKNAANNGVAGAPVTFSADSGVLQAVDAKTDDNGNAKATLLPGADRSNRDIKVTVKVGAATQTLTVPVTGSTVALAGAGSMLVGGQGNYTVTLKDSAGKAIPDAALAVSSALGNAVSPASVATDATGSAVFSYSATKAGNDTLTVRGAGASANLPLVVSSVDFAFASPAAGGDLAVKKDHVVRVRYLSAGIGMAGQAVNFSTTRGLVTAGGATQTDANGFAQATISSSTAGPAVVTAQIAGGAQTTLALNFVADTPDRITLQINPAAIAPNAAGSVANRAQLSALVIDADGNPVKGKGVTFSAIEDRSGGSIASGTGVTDANGQVSDTYISGAITSGMEQVRIRAAVAGTSIFREETLTVSRQALFISIATSNTITNVDETTYSKPFSLQVNDATGTAVANQTVVLSVFPVQYRKGRMMWNGSNAWVVGNNLWCANEDRNRNGFLDPTEDLNGNGRLEPGSPVIVGPASVTTDANGRASFSLTYGEQYAYWLDLEVTARTLVAGTESRAVFRGETWALESDLTSETVAPAGVRSPFGSVLSCTDPN
jgi:hypothetical protein